MPVVTEVDGSWAEEAGAEFGLWLLAFTTRACVGGCLYMMVFSDSVFH